MGELFIEEIAFFVKRYAPQYGISVCSPIIAQAILESAYGQSILGRNNNFFGLKYRKGRCPTASGFISKSGSEQNPDGSYTTSNMVWFKFPDMEAGVIGYFDFINISTYKNLKGITDPETYLKQLKADGYATSLEYVSNLMRVIKDQNLTRFDEKEESKMKITINAGHAAVGKGAIGAVGLLNESIEDRIVKDKIVALLRAQGHEVIDCTVDSGTQNAVLNGIISKTNAANADLNLSIHFNSGANRPAKDGKTTGTEVYIYDANTKCKATAQAIVNAIAGLGFKNRGVKVSKSLAFLKRTKTESILIEVCFVDDGDDAALYNADKVAAAIVVAITGQGTIPSTTENPPAASKKTGNYIVKLKTNLNIRKGPGIQYGINAVAKKGVKYTIVETSGGWGKLKSGLGWINISTSYVTYC